MEIILTGDGSQTIYLKELDESYHSINGAATESLHVFIHAGLNYLAEKTLNVFEVGFGTGLNALLTMLECQKYEKKINYHACELFPLDLKLIQNLNFKQFFSLDEKTCSLFRLMHSCKWNADVEIKSDFKLHKFKGSMMDIEIPGDINLVYFDAFSPQKQSEMWTYQVFNKLFEKMTSGSVLTTYCSKGEVKRTLKSVGFQVEKLSGPPGKREMLRAIKA